MEKITADRAVEIFKCLGDKTRFAIMEMLLEGDSYVELIAERLELTCGTVSHHLKKLEGAGLVTCSRSQFYMIYSATEEYLDLPLRRFFGERDTAESDTKYREKVIASFISGGRLTTIPSQMKKREIVWEHILAPVAVGKTLTEDAVNELIRPYHDDFCTIRRDFVALGFMVREHENYTRVK